MKEFTLENKTIRFPILKDPAGFAVVFILEESMARHVGPLKRLVIALGKKIQSTELFQ